MVYVLYSCAGGLANYKARFTVDYEMGMDVQNEDIQKNAPPAPKDNSTANPKGETDPQIKPADEDETFSWSNNAASSDMLF